MIDLLELGFPLYAALGFFATTIVSLILVRLFLSDSSSYASGGESAKKKAFKKDSSKGKQSDKSKHSKKVPSTNATSSPKKANGIQDAPKSSTEDTSLKVETPIVSSTVNPVNSTVKTSGTKEVVKKTTNELAASPQTSKTQPLKALNVSEATSEQSQKGGDSLKGVKGTSPTPNSPVKQASKEEKVAQKVQTKPPVSKSPSQEQQHKSEAKNPPPSSSSPPLSQSPAHQVSQVKVEEAKESKLTVDVPPPSGENADSQAGGKRKKKKAKKEGTDTTTTVPLTPDALRTSSTESPSPPSSSKPASPVDSASSQAGNDLVSPYIIHLRRRVAENVNLVDQLKKETTELRKDTTEKKQEIQQLKVKLAEQMTGTQRLREQNMQLLEKHTALEQQWTILQNQFAVNAHNLDLMKKRLEMEVKARAAAESAPPPLPQPISTSTGTTQTSEGGHALKELQRENAVLMQDLAAAKKMEAELRGRLHQQTEEQNRKHELEHQLFSLRSLVDSKDEEIQKVQSNVQDLTTRIAQMKEAETVAHEKYEQELTTLRADAAAAAAAAAAATTAAPTKPENLPPQENGQKLKELESQINALNEEIVKQREKNDVLRERNWKVMNRIQELEKAENNHSVAKIDPKNCQQAVPTHSEHEAILSISDENLKSSGTVERVNENVLKVKKLQEEVDQLKAKNNEIRQRNWAVMEELNTTREKMQQQTAEINRLNAETEQMGALRDEVESLKMQLSSCTRVLSNTEHILASLQTSVEEEETKWRSALEASETECDKARGELQRVYYELQRLHGNTDSLHDLDFAYHCVEKSLTSIFDEMNSKISCLTTELAKVCAERDQLEEQVNSKDHGTVEKTRTKSSSYCNGKS